jgi:hypothetical protein
MSGASLDLERQMLAHTLAIAPMPTLARVYVALCQTAPTEAAGGSELAGGGYARTAATFALLATPANAASNTTAVDFAPATSDWRPVSHFELWTAATGGTRLYWGQLVDPTDGAPIEIDVLSGSAVRFSPGGLVVQAAETTAAVGIGPFLPTVGGEMTGPLVVTATGTTNPRSVQDRFADELNVLDFYPGVYTSSADISDALNAALATGKNVYMPGGTYRWRKQIVVGNATKAQRLRGDGKSTYIIIEAAFDVSAVSIVKLIGAEANAPTLQDMHIAFAQPVAATNRADFVTLGTAGAGTGLLGVKYPPVVLIGAGCNRFIIDNVRFSNCWDGIHQEDGTVSTGGWWLKNIEISVYNIGLKLGKNKDFGHIQGWHHWAFNMTAANSLVMQDGGTFAMQFGIGGETEGVTGDNVNIWSGRVLVNNSTGWLHFSSLMMDAANSTLEHVQCQFTQISNLYFAGTPSGLNPNSQIQMSGGVLHIVNMFAFSGRTMITQTGGRLSVLNGSVNALVKDIGILEHSAGFCSLARLYINANTASGAWTQPLFRSTNVNGGFSFQYNTIIAPSVGDVGAVELIDHATNVVINNTFNGWKFTPPGTAGAYQTGSNFYTKSVTAGGVTVGGVASATTNLRLNATGQKAVEWYNASSIRWAAGPFTGPADDWVLNRYNDAAAFAGTAIAVSRASGAVSLAALAASTSYASDATAAAGGVAIGQLYRNGSIVMVRVA